MNNYLNAKSVKWGRKTSEITEDGTGGWIKVVAALADALTTALPPSIAGMEEDGYTAKIIY